MPRYFLEFCFKGTNYSGWQIQENAISVQQKVNEALSVLTSVKTETGGCGRTYTCVHAKQFFAHFDAEKVIDDKIKFTHQLNGIFSNDISVFDLHDVNPDAHARYDANSRTYEYYAYRKKNPFLKEFAAGFFLI